MLLSSFTNLSASTTFFPDNIDTAEPAKGQEAKCKRSIASVVP